jgi:hypothetical protein
VNRLIALHYLQYMHYSYALLCTIFTLYAHYAHLRSTFYVLRAPLLHLHTCGYTPLLDPLAEDRAFVLQQAPPRSNVVRIQLLQALVGPMGCHILMTRMCMCMRVRMRMRMRMRMRICEQPDALSHSLTRQHAALWHRHRNLSLRVFLTFLTFLAIRGLYAWGKRGKRDTPGSVHNRGRMCMQMYPDRPSSTSLW